MVAPPVSQRIEHVTAVRRRGRRAMAVLLVVAPVAVGAWLVAPSISLGIVAGVLVLGCLAVCVFTAVSDERAWRGVEHELDQLRRERARRA